MSFGFGLQSVGPDLGALRVPLRDVFFCFSPSSVNDVLFSIKKKGFQPFLIHFFHVSQRFLLISFQVESNNLYFFQQFLFCVQLTFPDLPIITGFYLVLPIFTYCYLVIPSFSEFYLLLTGFTEFYLVYLVLPCFT